MADEVFVIANFLEDNIVNVVENLGVNLVQQLDYELVENMFQHRKEKPNRNENYFEDIIPRYTISDFQKHFRMNTETMEVLTQEIGRRLEGISHLIPLNKKVLFTIWMLAKQESFLAAGDRFGIAPSTGHDIYKQIVKAISNEMDTHIVWPNAMRQQQSTAVFENRSRGFPGIIGALDGTHITIKQPIGNANDFYNRKGHHSIVLQAICNEDLKFINISTGYPGRMHDARVFRMSPIFDLLQNDDNRLIARQLHLLADSAYPLLGNVLTPYRDTGHLTQEQNNFNTKLCSVRSVIERAFGRLKGKFRKLKYLDMSDLELATQTIVASCVIHNLIISNEGVCDDDYSSDEDDALPREPPNINIQEPTKRGEQKRNYISDTLPQ